MEDFIHELHLNYVQKFFHSLLHCIPKQLCTLLRNQIQNHHFVLNPGEKLTLEAKEVKFCTFEENSVHYIRYLKSITKALLNICIRLNHQSNRQYQQVLRELKGESSRVLLFYEPPTYHVCPVSPSCSRFPVVSTSNFCCFAYHFTSF